MVETALVIYAIYLTILSIITFFTYGLDKKKAIKGKSRIPEKTLILMSLFGGALGGLAGMLKFRHKTALEHWYFSFFNIIAIIIHAVALIYLFTLL